MIISRIKTLPPRLLGNMQRRFKVARELNQEVDDLSFPPPYDQQARYLELASKFLSPNAKAEHRGANVVSIEKWQNRKGKREKAA
jgi:hypothetical protein